MLWVITVQRASTLSSHAAYWWWSDWSYLWSLSAKKSDTHSHDELPLKMPLQCQCSSMNSPQHKPSPYCSTPTPEQSGLCEWCWPNQFCCQQEWSGSVSYHHPLSVGISVSISRGCHMILERRCRTPVYIHRYLGRMRCISFESALIPLCPRAISLLPCRSLLASTFSLRTLHR